MTNIYLFFKLGDNIQQYPSPILYAWTLDKKYAREFQKQRNMKLFHKEVKEVNEKEISTFKYKYSKQRLLMINLDTSSIILGVRRLKIVGIVGPMTEEDFVFSRVNELTNRISIRTDNSAKYLKNQYIKVLCDLLYFDFAKIREPEEDPDYSGFYYYDEEFNNIPNVKYDSLMVFIYFFGNTMKK